MDAGTVAAVGGDIGSLFTVANGVALLTLTALEVVLGIDNIIFISILTGKLPEKDRPRAWIIGLGLAMGARIVLLLCITWVMSLKNELFAVDLGFWQKGFSGKDLILLAGGLFLVAKAVHEIHSKLEAGDEEHRGGTVKAATFAIIIVQIILIDMVFSLDSVITAVGMVDRVEVMIVAVVIAIGVMMVFAGKIGAFVERHPTIKMLALSFLILIGVMLTAEGFGEHINKGYIYFAMAFALAVEMVNLRLRKNQHVKIGGITGHAGGPGDLGGGKA